MLKPFYAKESDIPEEVKSFYVEKNGKWVLDAEGLVPATDVSDLRSKIDEFRSNNIELSEKLKKFEGRKVLSQEEQEEFDRLVEQEQNIKDKKLLDSGKIDELLANRTDNMRKDYEAQIDSLKKTNSELKQASESNASRLSKVMIRSEVSQLLSDQGINPVKGAMEDIYSRAGQVWKVNKDGKLQAINESGETVYGANGEPLTLKEWGQSIVKSAPYLFAESKGAGGDGNKGGGGGTPDGVIRIPNSDEALKSKHIADIAAGKAVIVED